MNRLVHLRAASVATLSLCALLAACEKKQPDKNVEVTVSWVTDRVPTAQTTDAYRKEIAEWFTPFRVGAPCNTRFYFKVTLVRKEGATGVKTELLAQKPQEIIDRIGGFGSRIGFKPGFKEIQEAAKTDIESKPLPAAVLAPKAPVESPANILDSLGQHENPALILYKNAPFGVSQPASAPGGGKTGLAGNHVGFQEQVKKAFCPAAGPGSSNQPADKTTPPEVNTAVLLVDLPEDPLIPSPPASAPVAPASAPTSAPPPAPVASAAFAASPVPVASAVPVAPKPHDKHEQKHATTLPMKPDKPAIPPRPDDQDTRRLNESKILPLPKHEVPK